MDSGEPRGTAKASPRRRLSEFARLSAPALALPEYELGAAEFSAALLRLFPNSAIPVAVLQRMAARSSVERRYLVRPLSESLSETGLGHRNQIYQRAAVDLATRAAAAAITTAGLAAGAIDLIISVSCTGFMIPSLDAHLVERLGLPAGVRRLPITELGCVGGAAGLARAADYLRAYPDHHALVVAVETPSLTFQPADGSADNIVSALLFGDGAAAVVAGGPRSAGACQVLDSASLLAPGTLGEMGFDLREHGFHVVLSGAVPALVREGLQRLVGPLLCRNGLALTEIDFCCVHPGGPKILQAAGEALGIEAKLGGSWDVLREYGNLSSAAVFFVLGRLSERPPLPGALGLLLSFGPGLSLEALLLRWGGRESESFQRSGPKLPAHIDSSGLSR